MGAVGAAVEAALKDTPDDWRTALARSLAAAMDAEPNASVARELRALMQALEDADAPTPEGSALHALLSRQPAADT